MQSGTSIFLPGGTNMFTIKSPHSESWTPTLIDVKIWLWFRLPLRYLWISIGSILWNAGISMWIGNCLDFAWTYFRQLFQSLPNLLNTPFWLAKFVCGGCGLFFFCKILMLCSCRTIYPMEGKCAFEESQVCGVHNVNAMRLILYTFLANRCKHEWNWVDWQVWTRTRKCMLAGSMRHITSTMKLVTFQ